MTKDDTVFLIILGFSIIMPVSCEMQALKTESRIQEQKIANLNHWEDYCYNYSPNTDKSQLARCRLVGNILVMEFVNVSLPVAEKPSWADYIDCRQVGRNRNGKIVAYDYGNYR